MTEHLYDVAVVGGGPAGLTTALYTTRLGHRTAIFEKAGGRHAAASHVHNLIGVSEDVSGPELAELATRQLEEYGADCYLDAVESVEALADGDPRFHVEGAHSSVRADRVVFATGFSDRPPEVPGLRQFTGRGLFYCLHCDAYTLADERVFVLGHDDQAAKKAMTLLNFTADVELLLDAHDPEWDEETDEQLVAHPIDRIDTHVVDAFPDGEGTEPCLGGLRFGDGTEREYAGGFAAYGKTYNTDLAADLGCERTEEGAISVDENRETSVEGVYAVGDVTHGQNQTPIAIGDGAYAGIAIHKDIRQYPLSSAELDSESPDALEGEVPAAPADLRARMRRVRTRETHAGLREPRPNSTTEPDADREHDLQ